MSNCGSRPKKMKYGGKVKKMEAGGSAGRTISDADRERLNALIGEISSGKKKKKMPSGPIAMPKEIRNKRARRISKGGAGELSPSVTRYKNGGCVMSGRGGKFKGIS